MSGILVPLLTFGHADDDAVELVREQDLATEPGVRLNVRGRALKHALLYRPRLRRSDPFEPMSVDVEMACRACTLTAAITVDAGDPVIQSRTHKARARFDFGGDVCRPRHLEDHLHRNPINKQYIYIFVGRGDLASRIFGLVGVGVPFEWRTSSVPLQHSAEAINRAQKEPSAAR